MFSVKCTFLLQGVGSKERGAVGCVWEFDSNILPWKYADGGNDFSKAL